MTEVVRGEKFRDGMLAQIPLGRWSTPGEVVKSVCFLLSDGSGLHHGPASGCGTAASTSASDATGRRASLGRHADGVAVLTDLEPALGRTRCDIHDHRPRSSQPCVGCACRRLCFPSAPWCWRIAGGDFCAGGDDTNMAMADNLAGRSSSAARAGMARLCRTLARAFGVAGQPLIAAVDLASRVRRQAAMALYADIVLW